MISLPHHSPALESSCRLDGFHSGSPARGVRVALYSHDTMGLGHLRRNLLIADALAESPLQATNLLITGAIETNFFRLPERADCFTLPRVRKSSNGAYASGQLRVPLDDLTRLRSQSICSALEAFGPDLLIVDKVPAGALNELTPALQMLAKRKGTKCVLGLRDVLDDPAIVAQELLNSSTLAAIDEHYDAIWVYGDARVYDLVVEYQLPRSIAQRVHFTGYIHQPAVVNLAPDKTRQLLESLDSSKPLIVCLVGGGQDGAEIAWTFVQALPAHGVLGVVVTGPFMPASELDALNRLSATKRNVIVREFVSDTEQLIERADRVVAMAGYNTVCSLLARRKPALLIPRVYPRSEQKIRAERLKQLGFVEMLLPDDLTIDRLRSWMLAEMPRPRDFCGAIGFDGRTRLVDFAQQLIGGNTSNHHPSLPALDVRAAAI